MKQHLCLDEKKCLFFNSNQFKLQPGRLLPHLKIPPIFLRLYCTECNVKHYIVLSKYPTMHYGCMALQTIKHGKQGKSHICDMRGNYLKLPEITFDLLVYSAYLMLFICQRKVLILKLHYLCCHSALDSTSHRICNPLPSLHN